MVSENSNSTHALFRKIKQDGTDWLFVILPDDGWAITCDGESMASGTSSTASVNMGIQKYLSFTSTEQRLIHLPALAPVIKNKEKLNAAGN